MVTPGIYGVGKAAESPPALCVLSHKPAGATKTIAWCGKGIMYDTGKFVFSFCHFFLKYNEQIAAPATPFASCYLFMRMVTLWDIFRVLSRCRRVKKNIL